MEVELQSPYVISPLTLLAGVLITIASGDKSLSSYLNLSNTTPLVVWGFSLQSHKVGNIGFPLSLY